MSSSAAYRVNHRFRQVEYTLEEYAYEVSESHVRLRTRVPLEVGARVQLAFTVDHDGFRLFEAEGEVVGVTPLNEPPDVSGAPPWAQMEVRIVTLSDGARQIVDLLRRAN
jgi:hypothetical protein